MAITQEDIDKVTELAKEYGATKLLLLAVLCMTRKRRRFGLGCGGDSRNQFL